MHMGYSAVFPFRFIGNQLSEDMLEHHFGEALRIVSDRRAYPCQGSGCPERVVGDSYKAGDNQER